MIHLSTLSADAKTIVENFVHTIFNVEDCFEHPKLSPAHLPYPGLIASLYARREGADAEVLQSLGGLVFDLENHFSQADINALMDEYPQVVMYCYEQQSAPRKQFLYFPYFPNNTAIPKSLVVLCLKLAQCSSGSNIYLPFAGTCPFALYEEETCNYDTAEIDRQTWAYSKILLSSQGISANVECRDCMVTDNGNKKQKRYDYIFSFPPLVGEGNHQLQTTILHLAQDALKDGGEMLCILPRSFCSYDSWLDVRKTLMWGSQNAFSATLITFKESSMLHSPLGLYSCLLHLKKDHRGTVHLMDATDKSFYKEELYLKVIEALTRQDREFVYTCKTSELARDNVSMLPSRYLVPRPEHLKELREVLEFIPPQRLDETAKNIPVIGLSELGRDYLQCQVTPSSDYELSSEQMGVIEDCMLVGFTGGKMKVGKTHGISPESPVALCRGIYPFRIKDTSVISTDFALRALLSESVEQQAKKQDIGFVGCSLLPLDELKGIVIDISSMDEQERLCTEDSRKALIEKDRQLKKADEDYRRDVHMKKHAIGQTLFNLSNWWKALQKARKEGNGVVCDTATVGKTQVFTVADIYENLQEIITQLQRQIDRFDRGYGLKVEEFALTKFVEDYISHNQSPLFTYDYDGKKHYHSRKDEDMIELTFSEETGEIHELLTVDNATLEVDIPLEWVKFAPEALKIIFDDIISNAVSHGFDGHNQTGQSIKIELTTEGTDHIVTISNNGRPLDDRLSVQDVFTYNRSSKNGDGHSGIGGYEIDRLMREFGGEAIFISDPNADFPVTYKLIFHKTNILYTL